MQLELIKPSENYIDSTKEVFDKFYDLWENWFWNPKFIKYTKEQILKYIQDTSYFEKWERTPEWRLSSVTYWLVDSTEKELLWVINIRPDLNDYLLNFWWNIWYAISPYQRKKWYWKLQLQKAIEKIKSEETLKHLSKVLLTCNDDNIWSRKIIESCWWIYEDKRYSEKDWVMKLRYWIPL